MKKSARKFVIFGVVLMTIASACVAPAAPAPTPTLVPPTLAPTLPAPTPTLVPPTLVPTQALPTLTATSVPPTAAATTDAVARLKPFQDAFNQGDTDSLMALFAEDPNVTIVSGLFGGGEYSIPAVNTKAVRDTFEIGFKLNSQATISDCKTTNNQATCTLVIKDDCNPPTANPYHIRTQFVFMDSKILSVYGRWDSDEEQAFQVYNAARQDWAKQNLPADAAVYDAYNSSDPTGVALVGLTPGETASDYGQAVDRICKGYTAAGH